MAKSIKKLIASIITLTMFCTIFGNISTLQSSAHTISVYGTAKFINTWLMAGPFDSSYNIDPSVTPTEGEDLDSEQWEYFDDRLFNRNLDDYQDLYGYYTVKKNEDIQGKKVYAHVYAYSPSNQDAQFRIGSSGLHKVWINGQEIGSNSYPEEVAKDRNYYTVSLNQGWNSILVEINHTRVHYLGFYGRITDNSGNEIDGLIYSVNGQGESLTISTKGLSFTENNMPIGYKDWPYVWMETILDKQSWRPQASKFQLYAEGGTPGYTWSIESGSLPDGLTLAADGTIDGRPTKIGVFDFTLKVEDSNNSVATKEFTIEVKERPNKWHEESRHSALVHCTPTYSQLIDENYSSDLWAKRIKDQGINFVYLETIQGPYYWPAPNAPEGTKDGLTEYVDAIKRHDIKLGLYYASEGGWHHQWHSSSTFVQDVEDLIKRYAPSQFFFDGYPNHQGNTDAMYSIVRAYDPDIIIEANPDPDLGDSDTKIFEAHGYWGNPAPDYWKNPDTKGNPLEVWRHPFTSEMGAWSSYHYGMYLEDWTQFAKRNITEMSLGYIANYDQMIQLVRGPGYKDQGYSFDLYPPTVQKLITMREMNKKWINPENGPSKLESVIGTYPGPLKEEKWGYSTYRDNKIYMHMIQHPDFIPDYTGDVSNTSKTGMPTNGSITVSAIEDNVINVTLINDGRTLDYTQNGNEVTIDLSGVEADPIDTIIKIETDKDDFEGYDLTDIQVSGKKIKDSKVQINVEGYLNGFVGLKISKDDFDKLTFTSSNLGVAQVDENGLVTSVSQGSSDIIVMVEYQGMTKEDVVQVQVDAAGNIRVNEQLIGAVMKIDGYETYEKLFYLDQGNVTLEGRGAKGNEVDLADAKVIFKTDKPNIVKIIDNKVVLSDVDSTVRAAVWADIELEQGQKNYIDQNIVFWDIVKQRMFKVITESLQSNKVHLTTNKVFLDISPLHNVALNKSVTVSEGEESASKANDGIIHNADGSDKSRWIAATGGEGTYWQVDLEKSQPINNVKIRYYAENARWEKVPNSITIQVSEDNTNWNTVVDKSTNVPVENSSNGYSYFDIYSYDMGDVAGRYVRLLFEDGSQAGIEIPEVEVYSSDTGNNLIQVNVEGEEVEVGKGKLTIEGMTIDEQIVDLANADIRIISEDPSIISINEDNTLQAKNEGKTIINAIVTIDSITRVGDIIGCVDSEGHITFKYRLDEVTLKASSSHLDFGQYISLIPSAKSNNGENINLSSNEVTYELIEGADLVSIIDNKIMLNNVPQNSGIVKLQATVTQDEIVLNSNIVEIKAYGTNIATVSTESASTEYSGVWSIHNAIDGVLSSAWCTDKEQNPWIQLNWDKERTINKIIIYPRSWAGPILGGKLLFSDNTEIEITDRLYDHVKKEVILDQPKTITWVKLQMNGSYSGWYGLDELEVISTYDIFDVNVSGKQLEQNKAELELSGTLNGSSVDLTNAQVEVISKDSSIVSVNGNILQSESQGIAEVNVLVTLNGISKLSKILTVVDENKNLGILNGFTLSSDKNQLKEVDEVANLTVSAKLSNNQDLDLNDAEIQYKLIEDTNLVSIKDTDATLTVNAIPKDNTLVKIKASITLDEFKFDSNELEIDIVGDGLVNIAPYCNNVIASSEFDYRYAPSKAIDEDLATEWASLGEIQPWIKLTWDKEQTIHKIILEDRGNLDDNIDQGTLTFSDDSTIEVTDIPSDGSKKEISFDTPKTITWVKFEGTGNSGYNNGLREFKVFTINNKPTVANPITDITDAKVGTEIVVDLSTVFDDADTQDTLTLAADIGTIEGNVWKYTTSSTGTETVTITATDDKGESVTDSFDVTVVDTDAPIVTFNPADAETNVTTDGVITITFNEAVRKLDDSALENADLASMLTLKKTNVNGVDVSFTATVDADKKVITITPDANLDNSQAYYVAISAEVEDTADNAITAANAIFTTVATDTQAPTITFEPADAETNVTTNGVITITFNEAVRKLDDGALENADLASMLTLKKIDVNGVDVAFTATVDADKKVITITPDARLDNSQVYYVAIAAKVEDAADNAITAANATFTTVAP